MHKLVLKPVVTSTRKIRMIALLRPLLLKMPRRAVLQQKAQPLQLQMMRTQIQKRLQRRSNNRQQVRNPLAVNPNKSSS